MAAVRRPGWFLGREIKSGDGFLGGGNGGRSSSRAPARAPAMAPPGKAAAAARQQPGSSAMAARITPAILFITVVLAVVLLVSGLLHILRRLFLKSHHANTRAEAVDRQLQQLFHLHEDGGAGPGLDQADIDALPAFAYGELAGAKGEKRPFDCAVCLCEFAGDDRLRLLPLCGHAFHAACIDTWLRSSSTCPLCRAALSARALAAATAAADASVEPDVEEQKQEQEAPNEAAGSVVLPVRLGRFKNLQGGDGGEASTSSCLDARRCYSMGSYQYVLADDNLLVSVHWKPGTGSSRSTAAGVTATASSHDQQGKKFCAGGRGDSFSVSKIWQWHGGDRRLPGLRTGASSPADDGLPWAPARENCTRTRQESDT